MSLINANKAMELLLSLPKTQNSRAKDLIFLTSRGFGSWVYAINNASSPSEVLKLYAQMHRQSVPFDTLSIHLTLKSCTQLQSLPLIRQLHTHLLKIGFSSHVYVATGLLHAYSVTSFGNARGLFDEMPVRNTVSCNTMITGYSNAGEVRNARGVFDMIPERDHCSWSSMIACYMNNGHWGDGLGLFREMLSTEELKPEQVTLGPILAGCGRMGWMGLRLGKSIHGVTVKNGWQLNVELGTVLADMYAKCGLFKSAVWIFDMMQERNVMSWTVMICGSVQNGYCEEALSIFEMMKIEGVRPNELTFTGVLRACAQAGFLEEGCRHFSIIEEYGLKPTVQHYGCMVDMFGKAGLLEEAYNVIETMSCEPNIAVWGAFLFTCKVHKKYEMAERVFDRVMKMIKPENDGGIYSLIADLYVLGNKWDDADRVREMMLNQNVGKARGSSFIRSVEDFSRF